MRKRVVVDIVQAVAWIVTAGVLMSGLVQYALSPSEGGTRALDAVEYNDDGAGARYMRDVCVEGVLYTGPGGLASYFSSAVLQADGRARRCDTQVRTLDELLSTYRPICRDGVAYVRVPYIRRQRLIALYDSATGLPRACG